MADTAKKTENNTDRQEIKELISRGKAFSFIGEKISKAYEGEDGEHYVETIASSDQEDLVGDIMSQKALNTMKTDFVGKTVFMNHRTNVPDDVFGSVVSCEFVKQDGMVLLKQVWIVEKENEPAMKTWRMLNAGRVQLGSSVTVLVNSHKPNPNRKGGIIIEDVEPIEVSIVGVPCNRESKTMTASAKKALEAALKSKELDMETTTETTTTEAAAEIPAQKQASVLVFGESSGAARQKYADLLQAVADSKDLSEFQPVAVKGMFQEILEKGPSFWDLIDILYTVRWNLAHNVYLIQEAGSTDFAGVLAEWETSLDEFKTACVAGFLEWTGIDGLSESKAMEVITLATEIEKNLKTLADAKTAASDERAGQLAALGKSIVELATQIGVPMETVSAPDIAAGDAPTAEQLEQKAAELEAMKTRAETAETKVKELETKLTETEETLEVTKAGLEAAVAATGAMLKQPLPVGRQS